MPNHYCCVLTCKMSKRNAGTDVRFIKFPVDPKLLEKWRAVIGRGPDFPISQSTRICSKHFVSGRRSLNPSSEDYIPSVFPPSAYRKRTLCRGCRKMNCICDPDVSFNPAQISGLGLPISAANSSLHSESSTTSMDDSSQLLGDEDDNDNDDEILNETDGSVKRKMPTIRILQPSSSTPKVSTLPGNKIVKREPEIDLLARIKEVELEQSRKLEMMSRSHTMTVANLREEFQQKTHTMKCEWEEEKQKLWGEIGYLKEVLTRRPYF